MSENSSHKQATRAISSGRGANDRGLSVPIWATAVWESDSADHAYDMAHSVGPDEFYSRHGNPTVSAFTDAVADIEGAEEALAFASGMGALASVVFALCSTGSHIVATTQIYGTTATFLNGPVARMGIETTWVNGSEPGAMAAAVIPGRTMLVIAETPSNPTLDIVDLDELGAIKGPFTMVDSTLATPFGQQPIRHGVDLVLHSATKGIAGHNDATLGVVSGEQELLDDIWRYGILHGASASPFDAMLALRGIRTLDVRQRRQSDTALDIASRLASHSAITAVHYPGLPEHPQHDRAASHGLLNASTFCAAQPLSAAPRPSSVNRGRQPIQVSMKMPVGRWASTLGSFACQSVSKTSMTCGTISITRCRRSERPEPVAQGCV